MLRGSLRPPSSCSRLRYRCRGAAVPSLALLLANGQVEVVDAEEMLFRSQPLVGLDDRRQLDANRLRSVVLVVQIPRSGQKTCGRLSAGWPNSSATRSIGSAGMRSDEMGLHVPTTR